MKDGKQSGVGVRRGRVSRGHRGREIGQEIYGENSVRRGYMSYTLDKKTSSI